MAKFSNPFPVVQKPCTCNTDFSPYQLKRRVINIRAAGKHSKNLHLHLALKLNVTHEPTPVISVRGYLQSWKYFANVRESVKLQLTFRKSVYMQAEKALRKSFTGYTKAIGKEPSTLIGIHVRRGDLLLRSFRQYGHEVATSSYLRAISKHLNESLPNTMFVVVSDDISYCRQLFSGFSNVFVVDGNSAVVDMVMLTLMDYLILTVGSFGWWAAYLGDARQVYYYKNWPRRGSKMFSEYRPEDYFLQDWIPAE